MSEPNQNENLNANEQQVFDAPQEAAAEAVENVAAPEAAAAGSVPMQDFVNQAAAPVQDAYGQQAYQVPNPNAQYGYAAPAPAQGVVAPKQKSVAGILGILLGALGIHKFYLGYTVPGLIMLLVTILTLGFGGIVMEIIGLIEGIMYLTMDDTQFYNTYVAGKKEWF
ncbi:MAG: TM2 domain-containing protein [Actinomycetaceae bacterium]|nr:TM2 domain-containing protein [Actinomycetaceae bacterium]